MPLSALEILAKEALLPAEHHPVFGSDQLFIKRQYTFLDAANPQTLLDMIALIRQLEHAIRVNQRYDDPIVIREALNALKEFDK